MPKTVFTRRRLLATAAPLAAAPLVAKLALDGTAEAQPGAHDHAHHDPTRLPTSHLDGTTGHAAMIGDEVPAVGGPNDLDALLSALPLDIVEPLKALNNRVNLLEVVMDLGRRPEARYRGSEATLSESEVTRVELDYVISRIGEFGGEAQFHL